MKTCAVECANSLRGRIYILYIFIYIISCLQAGCRFERIYTIWMQREQRRAGIWSFTGVAWTSTGHTGQAHFKSLVIHMDAVYHAYRVMTPTAIWTRYTLLPSTDSNQYIDAITLLLSIDSHKTYIARLHIFSMQRNILTPLSMVLYHHAEYRWNSWDPYSYDISGFRMCMNAIVEQLLYC